MCIYLKKNARKQIAKKDIICYKFTAKKKSADNTKFYSWWYSFKFILGEKYIQKITSFSEESTCNKTNKGFYSFKTLKNLYLTDKSPPCIVKCIIPKGAEYYNSRCGGERISNQIIIKEYIK